MLVKNISARLIHVGNAMIAPGETKEVNVTEHCLKGVDGLEVVKESKKSEVK